MSKCFYRAKWGMPKTNLRRYSSADHLYKYSWKEQGFHSGEYIIDLAKKTEQRDFSCKEVSYFQIEIEKGWKDTLLELIPYYSSTHITVYYLSDNFLKATVDKKKDPLKNSLK